MLDELDARRCPWSQVTPDHAIVAQLAIEVDKLHGQFPRPVGDMPAWIVRAVLTCQNYIIKIK